MTAQSVSRPVPFILNWSIILAVLGIAVWLYAPGIARDRQVAQTNLLPAYGQTLTEASCKNVLLVVTFCSISYRPNVATLDASIWYMVLGPVFKERITLMQRPDTGEIVTNFGINHLNRRYAALGLAGLLVVGAVSIDIVRRRGAAVRNGVMVRAPSGPVDGGVPNRPGGLPTHAKMPNRVPRTFGQRG